MQLQEKLLFYIWFWNVTEYINIIQNKLVNIHENMLYNFRQPHDILKPLHRKMLILFKGQQNQIFAHHVGQADGTWGPIALKTFGSSDDMLGWWSHPLVCLTMAEAKPIAVSTL